MFIFPIVFIFYFFTSFLGVILSKSMQKEEEMFLNKETENFTHFLSILGNEECCDEEDKFFFTGYHQRSSKLWYTSFRGHEIVFNISTKLDSESQRRLIGNNKLNIIFVDDNGPM